MENKMEVNTDGMREEMREMRGEMRQMGRCLQAGIMAPPRAGTNELKGSAPAGADQIIRGTCWASVVTEKVTVMVTQGEKLIGVTETCTSETRREVTELTETREIEERLHGKDGVEEDAHTHTHGQWRTMGVSLQSVLGPGAGSGMASVGNGGRRCAPLKRIMTRWVRSCRASLRGRVLRTGARGAWGV